MAITSLIVHRISKSSPTVQCELKLRDEPLPLDGQSEDLCRELKNTYVRKAGKMYGCLSDDSAAHPLKPLLLEYLEEKLSFVQLSHQFLRHLKMHWDNLELALDHQVFFFFEKIEAGDAFYIVVTEHNTGQYIDGDQALCQSHYLDTQNIVLAAKIKIPELLENQQQNYLSVLRWRGEKDLSEGFAEAVGFANKVDIAADTSQFLELVTHYTADLPEEEVKGTREQVVEFCLERDKSGQPVDIQDLSTQISHQEKPAFIDYAKKIQPNTPKELIPDKTQLRNYVRISGRNEQLSMSFASACLGDSVVYDAETDSITIKNLPAGLKTKLVQHLRKASEGSSETNEP